MKNVVLIGMPGIRQKYRWRRLAEGASATVLSIPIW